MVAVLEKIRPYAANATWLVSEKVLALATAFVVTAITARYLGPINYGKLAYAASLMSLLAAAGTLGLGGLVVRELVRIVDARAELLGTTLALKALAYFIAFLAFIVMAFLTEREDSAGFWLLIIVGASMLFKPLEVVDFWFQSQLQSRYTAIARTVALLIASVYKLVLVVVGANVVVFGFAYLGQSMVLAALLAVIYSATSSLSIKNWTFSGKRARALLRDGALVFSGSIFGVIYHRIDQVMLRWLSEPQELGMYAVAAALSEAWYFVPAAIVASVFPKLVKLRAEDESAFSHRLQQLLDFLFMVALVVAIAMTLFSSDIVNLVFGGDYAASASILAVHTWAAIFIFMRAAFSRWILIENALVFSMVTQGCGAILNVALNFMLIPSHGGYGAAVATLISYAAASYFSLFFYMRSRAVFWMMTKSLASPLRYGCKYLARLR